MQTSVRTTGTERFFDTNEVIVSKTNAKGLITYANRSFLTISGYSEAEVIGQPHNMIRHPQMPRCIFRLLWEHIHAGKEIFAYVVNRCKQGDHYWVLAHVTPSFNAERQLTGYHSNRRVPERPILDSTIIPLYQRLQAIEQQALDPKTGVQAAYDTLNQMLQDKGVNYDRFIFAL